MREFIKSVISFSMAVPLFAARQVTNLLKEEDKASAKDPASAFDSIIQETEKQMDGTMKGVFKGGDHLQRQVVDLVFNALPVELERPPVPFVDRGFGRQVVAEKRLDASTLVVLGEGLAGGMGDFGLCRAFQRYSFVAQAARQMGVALHQPLLEAPGLGDLPGFPSLPVRFPANMQYTALCDFPPEAPRTNLSLPGCKVADALDLYPRGPITHRRDNKQTAANIVLGMPQMINETVAEAQLPNMVDYALGRQPTFMVVALGYYDVLEPVARLDLDALPAAEDLGGDFARLFDALQGGDAEIVACTVPDPMDTAFFSTLPVAAELIKLEQPEVLAQTYGLEADDRVTVEGLMEMGYQLLSRKIGDLPGNSVLSADGARRVTQTVEAINRELARVATERNIPLFDLHGVMRRLKTQGHRGGDRSLNAELLGGLYTLNGYYPGPTGQALIANGLLECLNSTYGTGFAPVDLERVMEADPVADYRRAEGPNFDAAGLDQPYPPGIPDPLPAPPLLDEVGGEPEGDEDWALKLPPGREQVLPLNKTGSYFGDAIRAVHCEDDPDREWGSSGDVLFGGLCMLDSHLSGYLHLSFSEPVDGVTRFEVRHGEGLVGDDGRLSAPLFFRLPALHNNVKDDPKLVSHGTLDLKSGEVKEIEYAVRFGNTALMSLVRVNPAFPDVPIQFPGMYGSAHATFAQRPDGKLDFTFYGTTFIPLSNAAVLGRGVRFPLPFCSPTLQFANIPADGSSLHPHLHLTTSELEPAENPDKVPEIPTNTIREYTAHTRNTCFGDKFSVNIPELGGDGTGRSHLMGRIQIQFGERFGDSVSIAVLAMPPGGLLAHPPVSPLRDAFPGRLSPGLIGHNEALRFPARTYYLESVYYVDDPFELSVGAVNVHSGRSLGEVLHRGLIGQDLFFALMRVEPRTPQASFCFRGPAFFEKGPHGEELYRFISNLLIDYPVGYKFPAPDLSTTFEVRPGKRSILDPFLWFQGMHEEDTPDYFMEGGQENVRSSKGDFFSFRYAVGSDPQKHVPLFEYTNHDQDGVFRLDSLAWVNFTNSKKSKARKGHYDTLTFTAYGTWSKGGSDLKGRLASVQVATAKDAPYVSIQIDGGFISNVNLKPEQMEDARP
jgi:hypothetical protein